MAIVSLPYLQASDLGILAAHGGFGGVNLPSLTATITRAAHVLPIRRSGTITEIGFRLATVTTAQQCQVSLQTVDASGVPTGTLYGGSSAVTFTPASNTDYALTVSATATQGDVIAVVWEWTGTAGDLGFGGPATNTFNQQSFPYRATYSSGAWAKIGATYMGVGGYLKYSDGVFSGAGMYASTGAVATATYNLNTAGSDEYALRMQSTARVRIAGLATTLATNAGDFEAILYDSDSTVLASRSVDGDWTNSNTVAAARTILFTTSATVAAGSTIYLALRPTTTTGIGLRRVPILSGTAETFGLPAGACEATRVDQGTWSTNPLFLPAITPIYDGLDDGASGGLILPRAMDGGYSA